MMTNLAYAGATYTEARYYVPAGANPTVNPTPPSTSTNGTGQYGYLYNYCAAMGGQNTAACAYSSTPVPNPNLNICPSGWRLPTGSSGGDFQILNTNINDGRTNTDAGLLSKGLFQYSGYWYNSFNNQGNRGGYWSSTQSSVTNAFLLGFYNTESTPVSYNDGKYGGFSVRCVAQ